MFRAFLLIGSWLKSIGIDPGRVKVTIRFMSMADRIRAQTELDAGVSPKLRGTMYGIGIAFTDPTHD